MEKIKAFLDMVINWGTETGIRILVALVILIIAFRLITVISRRLERKLKGSQRFDRTLVSAALYAFKIIARILVLLCLVDYLGIDTSVFTALITSLGVCFGLAVNGALSNLAGGVLLLLTRPFRLDDFIKVGEHEGYVEDIRIVNTKIRTLDNKIVYLPNGALSSGDIVNYTEKEFRRIDVPFSVAYGNDFEKAEELIKDVCRRGPLFLDEPEPPFARIMTHGADSVEIMCRVWVKTPDYWPAYFDLMEMVKQAFDQNGIEIPFRQVDIHVRQD